MVVVVVVDSSRSRHRIEEVLVVVVATTGVPTESFQSQVWCFAGEDLQKRVQKMTQMCVKGNNVAGAVNKLVRHYRLAMMLRFLMDKDEALE